MCNPQIIQRRPVILASQFKGLDADIVVTVETKGIPLAYEVAKMLGVNLIIVEEIIRLQKDLLFL
jgi:purine operon repressor